jgi:hypothetical protein
MEQEPDPRVLLRVLNVRRRGMRRSLSEVVRRVEKDGLDNVSFAVPIDACFAGTNLTLLCSTISFFVPSLFASVASDIPRIGIATIRSRATAACVAARSCSRSC